MWDGDRGALKHESIFDDDDTSPDIPVGHLSAEKLAGKHVPVHDIFGNEVPTETWRNEWPEQWETVEDPPATDEPLDEVETSPGHRRPRDIPRWAIPALIAGGIVLAWSFWMIGNSSASEERSRARTAVDTSEPSVSPGPTVTRTVRAPRVVVTRGATVRATVTVRVRVTATKRVYIPGRPGPTVTKTVTKCPDWGCS